MITHLKWLFALEIATPSDKIYMYKSNIVYYKISRVHDIVYYYVGPLYHRHTGTKFTVSKWKAVHSAMIKGGIFINFSDMSLPE